MTLKQTITCGTVLLSLTLSATARAQSPHFQVADPLAIGGSGRWDYILADSANHLLYVPRTTHTQVIDEQTGKVVADIDGQKGNHGVALVPKVGRGFITDGDGAIFIFDIKTNAVLGSIKAPADADGIIYDESTNKVIAVSGDGGVVLLIDPALNLKSDAVEMAIDPALNETSLDLGGKPEYLAADGQGKVYINLEDKDQVAVVDINAKKVLDHWPVAPGGSPVGMSIDRANKRLFIGCRKPAKMIVMSTADGKILGDFPIGTGVDATVFDAGLAYASCGDGTVTVVGDKDGKLAVLDTIKTAQGARTMTIDPATHTLYLPTSDFEPKQPGQTRAAAKAGTFKIVVVKSN